MSVIARYRLEALVLAIAVIALVGGIWWGSTHRTEILSIQNCPVYQPPATQISEAPDVCK